MQRVPLVPFGIALGITFFAFFAFVPMVTHAAFFGPIIPPACNCDTGVSGNGVSVSTSAPAWGCILATFDNVIAFAAAFSVVIITIFIAWAGFSYMTAGSSPEKRSTANKRILNAVIGIVIVLASYLLVDSLMKVLYNPNAGFGPWNSILAGSHQPDCLAPIQNAGGLPSITAATNPNAETTPGQTTTTPSNGSCADPSVGPCSVANLQSTCFGNNAANAGQICNKESGANPTNLSRSDVTSDGHSYSVGLFQMNLTNSFKVQVDGQSCSNAFSGKCQGGNVTQSGSSAGHCNVTVINQQLYNDCVAAAENGTTNIQAACMLNNNGNSGWRAWSTHTACGI